MAELMPLMEDLHREAGEFSDLELDVCWEVYEHNHVHRISRYYTVREEGELIGLLVMVVHTHTFYPSMKIGIQDVVYVKPERRGLAGIKLFKFAEVKLKEEGVDTVMLHTRVGGAVVDFGKVLERLGYRASELTYSKRI